MWVIPDDLYILAAQNAIGDRNFIKLGGLTGTLLGYSFFKNQPDSMRDDRDTSCKLCATEKWAGTSLPEIINGVSSHNLHLLLY